MKSLKTLIRLHKNEVDEKRRHLTQLREHDDQLTLRRQQFEAQVEMERQLSGTSVDMAVAFANFLPQIKLQRNALEQARQQLLIAIHRAEEDLAQAFQELKRFELAEEERIRKEKAELARKEAMMLDEIAAQRHLRQQEEGGTGEE
ncbi:flagellar FliJ family protein [Nitrospirillum sp. BR 11752]|uniref:Flagellar FliJ protein n=1 Tax=Nitrospirillum amazonense TaxID=28077 RepID=A0A560HFM6_9PROT|nr:flagellar FliJ family protein [Nitrospirillum amazonense]MEE3627071.1 flagellar FliJ family protein [Nitrospirillum sp. BR 11752]TWB44150.1 flagellar export protein FliJ [Nitrospirillum amazonense]